MNGRFEVDLIADGCCTGLMTIICCTYIQTSVENVALTGKKRQIWQQNPYISRNCEEISKSSQDFQLKKDISLLKTKKNSPLPAAFWSFSFEFCQRTARFPVRRLKYWLGFYDFCLRSQNFLSYFLQNINACRTFSLKEKLAQYSGRRQQGGEIFSSFVKLCIRHYWTLCTKSHIKYTLYFYKIHNKSQWYIKFIINHIISRSHKNHIFLIS